jgi:CheY-like chemotaxis protein
MMEEQPRPLILIVDDVPRNLQVLGMMLKEEGYQVAAAQSGVQALDMLEDLDPDLVLLDIMMPELDGLAACRRIHAIPRFKTLPIIFLTAKTEKEDVVNGLQAGGVDYVSKPFNADELLARVKTHVELKRARDSEIRLIKDLQQALAEVKQLSGLLPICFHCKKIRDDQGYWENVEEYIEKRSDTQFSHGLCPDCMQQHYPEIARELEAERIKAAQEQSDRDGPNL